MLFQASRAVTVNAIGAPATVLGGTVSAKCVAVAGVTVTAWLTADTNGALASTESVPAEYRVTPAAKVWLPPSAALNVYDAPTPNARGSLVKTRTVPVKSGTTLPSASTTVTVTGTAVPATLVAG